MRRMQISALEIAQADDGLMEIPGEAHHPFIQWCFSLCNLGLDTPDETPWCSAFMQHPFHVLGLERSHSAAARSWLKVGKAVDLEKAEGGFDVVVLKRGVGGQPGPEVIKAPGHVGLYVSHTPDLVSVYGGNQSNRISLMKFGTDRILSIQRIA